LPILFGGFLPIFPVRERMRDCAPQSFIPMAQSGAAFFWENGDEIVDQRIHAPHDLHAARPISPNFIERQLQKIVPCWKRKHESQFAFAVTELSDLQVTAAETEQQVLDLVQGLDRSRRIVNRWG
jgi:hypothetical protein